MAIRTNAIGSGALLVPETNFKQAMDGNTIGLTFAFMIRLPATGMTNNGPFRFGCHDANAGGTFADASESQFVIGGDSTGQGANQMRPGWNDRGNSSSAQTNPASTTLPFWWTGFEQMARDVGYMFMVGIRNIGTSAAPIWRNYMIGGRIGAASVPVATLMPEGANFATWLAETNAYFTQLLADLSTSGFRSPDGTAIEHTAVMWHNIPWDSGTDLPLISAVQPLYRGEATYSDPTFLNGGSIRDWRRLASTTDLADYSPQNRAAATIRGTLVDAPAIGIGVWNGVDNVTINTPPGARTFIGGRGAGTRTFSGTWLGTVTGVQFRVETEAGAALPGLDWQAVATFNAGGTWSQPLTLPLGGPYRLRVRATNNNALTANLDDLLVGTIVVDHGQSGTDRGWNAPNLNTLALAVAAGAEGVFVDLTNKTAGVNPTYVQPGARIIRLRGGQTPTTVGQGVVAALNEWHAAGGGPLCIVNLAIGGTNMADWANNAQAGNEGTPGNWPFLGNLPISVPGLTGPEGSGVMGYLAWLVDGEADLHSLMWTPGFVPASANAYRAATEARFTKPGNVKWIVFPPWRGDRSPPDSSSTVAKRKEHVDWVAQLPAGIGVLGPTWLDVVSDGTGTLHAAFNSAPGVPNTTFPISDGNHVGQARIGRGKGRCFAWVFNPALNAYGPSLQSAAFTDASRTVIRVQTGRALRTLNGAAIAPVVWISENSGGAWSNTGFSIAIDGNDLLLTKTSGSWPAGTTRVDYGREWPFTGAGNSNNEANTDGGTNFAVGQRAGNLLQGTNDNGIAVNASTAASIVADGGSFALAGSAASVSFAAPGAAVVPAAGAFALAGSAASVSFAAPGAAVVPAAGAFALAGSVAVVVFSDAVDLWPITLAEARAHLHILPGEEADDTLIASLVRTAADAITAQTGVVLRAAELVAEFPAFAPRLVLPARPVIEVLGIDWDDPATGAEQTIAPGGWRVRTFAGEPALVPAAGESWPTAEAIPGAVRVRYRAGYASNDDVPESLRTAARQLVAHWWVNRETVNVGNIVNEYPAGTAQLLRQHRRRQIA